MKPLEYWLNKIHCGDVLEILKQMPDNSIDVVITSPPYWSCRDYSIIPSLKKFKSKEKAEEWMTQKIIELSLKYPEHEFSEGKIRSYSDGTYSAYIKIHGIERVWSNDETCQHEIKKTTVFHPQYRKGGLDPNKHKQGSDKGTEIVSELPIEIGLCSKCGGFYGQLGLEPHPQMYIDNIVRIMHEIKRILKPTGSLWLNIGDVYYTRSGSTDSFTFEAERVGIVSGNKLREPYKTSWLQPKQKLLLPERIAIAMQEDGWILRNSIVWYKPDTMPQSVKDRFTSSYEFVFFFVKERKYYSDFSEIKEPFSDSTIIRAQYDFDSLKAQQMSYAGLSPEQQRRFSEKLLSREIIGRNPRDVWSITTKSFPDAHFAIFPEELVEKILKCACPKQVCIKCGKPRFPIIKHRKVKQYTLSNKQQAIGRGIHSQSIKPLLKLIDCECKAGWKPGVVLDPFVGSGTTCYVAKKMGFDYIGIDINPLYCDMARQRLAKIPQRLSAFIEPEIVFDFE